MSNIATAVVLHHVGDERVRQEQLREDRKWGTLVDEDYFVLHTVLSEEVGEVARAILELDRVPEKLKHTRVKRLADLHAEAVQTAAVASQIAEKAWLELEAYKATVEPGS